MAEPADSALVIAQKHLNDNRAVIGGKTATGYRVAVLPTHADGKTFTAQKGNGTAATGTPVAATPTAAAHLGSADVERVTVPIDFATTTPQGGSAYVRKQFFRDSTGNPVSGKWCYVNSQGWPLLADGTKAASVAAAPNALTVPMSAVGEAVTSWSQPGPMVGVHTVSERQQGYAPYLGWTVKQVAQNGV
jgi:hypothetical protein